jgi:2-iminobutanoate/2-iminopropanoate deaminase
MNERTDEDIQDPLKRRPEGARQHVTAGPYSPVLEIDAPRLAVISGQVAVDLDGRVIGSTIEEQTSVTLRICGDCLASAGCTLGDVFKVNIYLADLGHWARFNEVYQEVMPEPLPVRMAVQAILLPGYLVEIEMWAVKAKE